MSDSITNRGFVESFTYSINSFNEGKFENAFVTKENTHHVVIDYLHFRAEMNGKLFNAYLRLIKPEVGVIMSTDLLEFWVKAPGIENLHVFAKRGNIQKINEWEFVITIPDGRISLGFKAA